jgi:hypothetical protein
MCQLSRCDSGNFVRQPLIAKGTDKGTARQENRNPLGSPRGFELREQDPSGVYKQKAPLFRGALSSAGLSDVRTPYLRLRFPIIVLRVHRGKAKLVVNVAKLGEYLALAPEEIDRLAPLH